MFYAEFRLDNVLSVSLDNLMVFKYANYGSESVCAFARVC